MTPIGWLRAAFPVRQSCSLQGSLLCLLRGEKVGEDSAVQRRADPVFCAQLFFLLLVDIGKIVVTSVTTS